MIELDPGRARLHAHRDNVVSTQFEPLRAGDEVRFFEAQGGKGAQAKRVSIGKHHVPGQAVQSPGHHIEEMTT